MLFLQSIMRCHIKKSTDYTDYKKNLGLVVWDQAKWFVNNEKLKSDKAADTIESDIFLV
jgi:hypothetical protein